MSWATAQGSSRKDREKYAEKYTDRKRFRRKFSHLSSVIKFPTRVVLYHVWFDFIWDILGGKTTFKLALLTLIFIMGHENFTHRFNFQKQQSSTVRFIFSLIKILLLKFSPKELYPLKKFLHFSVKFMRLQSWNFLFRYTVLLYATNFNLTLIFITRILISCMGCKMHDLISY